MKNCPTCHQTFEDALSFCPRDGEVLQEVEGELVGQVLDGKYEVETFIAQGGMGAVYRARHILLGDRVVIKTLRPEMRGNAEWLRRFQREGRAARSFRHPNAVTVYDLSAAAGDGLVYMVMEYVEGRTLDKELKSRGRLRPEEALWILETVADVLDAAHARGVVHRDLKPENIMLGGGEHGAQSVKVLDLGIAKMLGAADAQGAEGTSLTIAGQILGTPYYMSPEQWGELPRDGSAEIDGRADVYSLGVIAFELVAGHRPLGGRTLPELRQAHVAATLPSVQAFAPSVPDAFGRAIAHAMAKDRNDRPSTAGEFIDELRAALGLAARQRRASVNFGAHIGDADSVRESVLENDAKGAGRVNQTASPREAATVIDEALQPPPSPGDTSAQKADRATGAQVTPATVAAGATHGVAPAKLPTPPGAEVQTNIHHARHEQRQPQPLHAPVAKRGRNVVIAATALALLLVLGGIGWLAWKRMDAGRAEEGLKPNANTTEAPPAVVPKVAALSYWVESFGASGTDAPQRRAAESLALASGEYFQFHFVPRERGYLYIIGPGRDGNAPTLFLGAHGGGKLKNNVVAARADFAFPYGEREALKLDKNPGAEEYTVIFSPTPLLEPSALARQVPYTLKPEELKELEDFRARHRTFSPALSVAGDSDETRAVSVLVPESRDASQPFIFEIRIEHK